MSDFSLIIYPQIVIKGYMRFALLCVLLTIWMALPAGARPVDTEALDARLNRLMKERGMVGMAVVVVEDGQIIHRKGYGVTLQGSGDPVTEDTVFRWASLSKAIGAAMAVKLAEDGKIDLSRAIGSYNTTLRLPGGGEDEANMYNLLAHQLSIVRNAYDNRLEAGTMPGTIRKQLRDLPIECAIGTCHGYQNVAYDTVSEIVSGATGEPYQLATKRMLFDPLSMDRANMTKSGLQNSPRWARPHNRNGRNVYRRMSESYFRVPAAGGVNGSISDMGIWMLANMGAYPNVLSTGALSQLQTPQVMTPRERRRVRRFFPRMTRAEYGLGWRIYDYAGNKTVGHRGAVNGYRAMIMFDPAKKSGVAVLWNSSSNQPVGIQLEVMDAIYDLPAQDWLYLDQGPDLRKIRRLHPEVLEPEIIPIPRISPQKQDRHYPDDHGAPLFTVSACFGFSSRGQADLPFEEQSRPPQF